MIRKLARLLAAPLVLAGITVPALSAQAATCTTSAQYGRCSYPPYVVNQDVWNPGPGGTQTLTASSAGSWSVVTSQPPGKSNNSYVRSYPNVSQNMDTTAQYPMGLPYSRYSAAVQTFTQSERTASGTWESATDAWLNGAPGTPHYSNATVEVMVWTNNHGQYPAGIKISTMTMYGVTYDVWQCKITSCASHEYFAFEARTNTDSGQIHLVTALNWLVQQRLMPATIPFTQIQYGWEVGNLLQQTSATLTMSRYSNYLVHS